MNESPLKISNISKSFDKKILSDIEFKVNGGEIFGFIGLNGQGKTTLIKIILDLLDQDEGEVEIFGVSKLFPDSRKSVFYLPEKFQPSSNQTGAEFISFALSFYNKKVAGEEVDHFCLQFDFDKNSLNKKIGKYSKGMVQKIGLISAFMSGCDLIILDEPMSGLDPLARVKLKKAITEYKILGKTVFFSSHILSDIEEICDSIAILHQSKLVYCGAPTKLIMQKKVNNLEEAFLSTISQI